MSNKHWFQNRSLQILLGLSLVVSGTAYYRYSLNFVSTDNAYINANTATVAPQVLGAIQTLSVTNHQFVNKGQLLLELDPRPYQLALEKAQADLALARQSIAELEAAVRVAQADLNQSQAQLEDAERSLQRTQKLVAQRYASTEDLDKAVTMLKSQTAALESASAKLEEARIQLGLMGEDNAAIQAAQSAVKIAELDLSYTQVRAPSSGQIINLSNRPGDVVQAGQPLFALINQDELWVDSNFKETQLAGIKPGLRVDIAVDTYPDISFDGVVEQVSGGSGAAFSLLPPQNATGNWVKVTQRFPVRVRITKQQNTAPLRVGMSADVRVHLKEQQTLKKHHDESPAT